MSLKILHLFYDLMNLYGDYGNVSILERRLQDLGMDVVVDRKTLGDSLFDGEYDFVYCGAGTENKRDAALKALCEEKEVLSNIIKEGTHVLFTGNAWEMLGRSICTVNGETLPGVGIFDFEVFEDPNNRITGDVLAETPLLAKPVCGFVNKCSSVAGCNEPLFTKLSMGPGNQPDNQTEGCQYKNFYGTELIGPILVKNPHLLNLFLKELCGGQYRTIDYPEAGKAYDVTLNALLKRMEEE